MSSYRFAAILALVSILATAPAAGQRKKKPEKEVTQALEVLPDPPLTVTGHSERLVFHTAPLSNRGLLSQQLRDAIKALFGTVRGASILKIRAFVAGSGDVRRVSAIVAEEFSDRRQKLPALTVIQVGALPLEGAQVLMEATSQDRRDVNPNGVAFVPAQDGFAAVSAVAGAVRRLTCFMNSFDRIDELRAEAARKWPQAAAAFLQLRRDSAGSAMACEAVIAPDERATLVPRAAVFAPGGIVLSGGQLSFGTDEAASRLATDRLGKALESAGGDWESVQLMNVYALTAKHAQLLLGKRTGTAVSAEGLPSLDAHASFEVVARARQR